MKRNATVYIGLVLIVCFLILCLKVYYEGFDPKNAGYSAPAAKEYADIFGFDRLREKDTSRSTKYYVPPLSLTIYYFVLAFLLCMFLIHYIFELNNSLMAYVYFSIVSGTTVYFLYSRHINFLNGMYIG